MVWHLGLCLPPGLTKSLCHTRLCQVWPLVLEGSGARQAHFHEEIPISSSPADLIPISPGCSCEYYVNDAPRVVLDKLESLGYRVVSMTGVGQTLVWCLHRE